MLQFIDSIIKTLKKDDSDYMYLCDKELEWVPWVLVEQENNQLNHSTDPFVISHKNNTSSILTEVFEK